MAPSTFFKPAPTRRPNARTEPVAFVSREFVRLAATIALVMAVADVLPIGASTSPVVRLKFIIAWSALMAGFHFAKAKAWSRTK